MTETLTATEFKAKCLDVLDRVGAREVERVVITKRGRVVGMLVPPEAEAAQVAQLHGLLRGSVAIPAGFDLADQAAEEAWAAEQGVLHG